MCSARRVAARELIAGVIRITFGLSEQAMRHLLLFRCLISHVPSVSTATN